MLYVVIETTTPALLMSLLSYKHGALLQYPSLRIYRRVNNKIQLTLLS